MMKKCAINNLSEKEMIVKLMKLKDEVFSILLACAGVQQEFRPMKMDLSEEDSSADKTGIFPLSLH